MFRTFISSSRKRTFYFPLLATFLALAGAALAYAHASSGAKIDHAAEASDGVSVLLNLADTAFHDQRFVAPAGSNMVEFYLSVLELVPSNQQARLRLQAAFQPGCQQIEHDIGTGDLDEAERELRLLRDYAKQQSVQSENYKLALLGSYLYAQRDSLSRAHAAEAFQMQDSRSAAALR